MRRVWRKIKFNLLKLYINVYTCLKPSNKKVAIISCDKWKNKILEDIRLKYYLSKSGIKSKIISWESDSIDKYDAIIIRSIWGFDKDKFLNWLKGIKDIKVFNSIDLIQNNLSKKDQYDLLDKYGIKHIPTYYIYKSDKDKLTELVNKYNKVVVKPSISESGNNTIIVTKDNLDVNIDGLLLVQPYLESINNGEISIISINKKISHGVRRYPGVFSKYKKPEEISINSKLTDIVNKIININEYDNSLYIRVDFIEDNNEYLVLEVELIDPVLFFDAIENKKDRVVKYQNMVKEIKNKIEN